MSKSAKVKIPPLVRISPQILVTGCGHSLGRRDYGIREIAEGTFHRLRLKELQKDFRKTHVDE